jgi:diguanylate cyclase (GGDEF)-like protein
MCSNEQSILLKRGLPAAGALLILTALFGLFEHFLAQNLAQLQQGLERTHERITDEIRHATHAVDALHYAVTDELSEPSLPMDETKVKTAYLDKARHNALYSCSEEEAKQRKAPAYNILIFNPLPHDTALRQEIEQEWLKLIGVAPFFSMVEAWFPQFSWSYFVSVKGFTLLVPGVCPDDFDFSIPGFEFDFYKLGTSEKNPKRKLFFTPVYIDQLGKGPMVTVGKPVYIQGVFRGVVDLDVTLSYLSRLLAQESFDARDQAVITNSQGQVVGASQFYNQRIKDEVVMSDNLVPSSILSMTGSQLLQEIEGYYAFKVPLPHEFNLIYWVPKAVVWEKTGWQLFPVVVVLLLIVVLIKSLIRVRRERLNFKELSMTDPLTKAYNRRFFHEMGDKAFLQTQRERKPIAVLMLDIDHFKQVNDTYGHEVGDEVLRGLVKMLEQTLRRSDLFARFGGEEFCILLENVSEQGARQVAQNIRQKFSQLTFKANQETFKVTLSIGVAYGQGESLKQMILVADDALYQAKEKGRNQVVVFRVKEANGASVELA